MKLVYWHHHIYKLETNYNWFYFFQVIDYFILQYRKRRADLEGVGGGTDETGGGVTEETGGSLSYEIKIEKYIYNDDIG